MGKLSARGRAEVGKAEGIGSESARSQQKGEEQRHSDGDDKPEVDEKIHHQIQAER